MRKNAFTLAEVLITLGIIGVVAAMTMPTLINQTNGAQYKAAYKKALSAIAQGITLSVALDDLSFADTETAASDQDADDSITGVLKRRMNVVKTATENEYTVTGDNIGTFGDGNITLYFNDSSVFSFPSDTTACTESEPCYGAIDVNGQKGPNKEVTCTESDGECQEGTVTVTDVYPVKFYDQTILPATAAARAVLYGK